MVEFLERLFDTSDFPARWQCGNWSASLGWMHIASDVAIFAAYTAIPCVLAYFIIRRRDVPFLPVFWLFALFIFFCGSVHLIEASLFWQPWYRLSGLFKLGTAVVSWATVLALIPVVPKALALPGLADVNQRLEAEIAERRKAEDQQRDHAEQLRRHNEDLERFSGSIVGREERVIELKQEVNDLLRELGRTPRYLVGPADSRAGQAKT